MQVAPDRPFQVEGSGKSALISVIIRCYNQGRFLAEALESALAQSYAEVEVVVVDDGSTDDTAQIAARYPGVRYIYQPNLGRCAAGNTGLRECRGEYVVFLDADDRLLPGALEAGLACLREHPECAFVHGHYRLIDASGSPLSLRGQPCVERDHYLRLLQGNYIGMDATVLFRRSVFDAVAGFDTRLAASEDFDLYLRIAREFPIRCHGQLVAEYRRHEANTTSDAELMLKTTLSVLRTHHRQVRGNKRYEAAYKVGVRFGQEYYGRQLVDEVAARVRGRREWGAVARGLLALLRYYPLGVIKPLWRRLSGQGLRPGREVRIRGNARWED